FALLPLSRPVRCHGARLALALPAVRGLGRGARLVAPSARGAKRPLLVLTPARVVVVVAARPRACSGRGATGRWRVGVSSFSFLPSFFAGNKEKEDREKAERLKEEFLAAIKPLDRGADATPEDKERVEKIVQQLEEVNPVKEPLKSDLLNGKWELLYTTSESILQPKRPKFLRPFGTIYQSINTDTLRAQNMETWPYFNQVTANLVPLNSRRVAVKFDYFKIFSLIPIKAPGSGKGELEITYLDEELRASRGDKGNLFILKMVDPTYRVPLS
uniref:Plastid lipid-associated protein/fibrillin conserved domain-containing protein n=1 Tax=Oryza brachyantha TaxID=4533 RepID=J3LRZ7_ORYBR